MNDYRVTLKIQMPSSSLHICTLESHRINSQLSPNRASAKFSAALQGFRGGVIASSISLRAGAVFTIGDLMRDGEEFTRWRMKSIPNQISASLNHLLEANLL